MAIGKTKSDENIPEYHEKIYDFDRDDIETKLKDFILSHPNMQCLVSINYSRIPAELLEYDDDFDESDECLLKHRKKFYHS